MRVLISGAGIAGPTLAWWLNRFGMSVTIVEQSPALRTGGYVVDFWGSGFEVAERMGLLPAIVEGGYHVRELRAVGPTGRTIAAMPASAVGAAMGNRFVSVPRSEISAAVFAALGDRVETIFGDAIDAIEQTGADVAVRFAHHPPRRFDLVIGADGLHSRTRALVFGPEDRFERYLGIKVAAFEARGYRPRDELVYVMYSEVGQQAARFALRDDRTMNPRRRPRAAGDRPEPVRPEPVGMPADSRGARRRRGVVLRSREPGGMAAGSGLWTKGRVALVGDAAFAVSLLGGQGTALAMAAACVLAGELHRAGGDHGEAFARYERLFGPFIAQKQQAARRFAGVFAPKSRLSLFLRYRAFNLLSIPWIARAFAGREFSDTIAIPAY